MVWILRTSHIILRQAVQKDALYEGELESADECYSENEKCKI